MKRVFIHTATRVKMVETIDDDYVGLPEWSAVVIADNFTFPDLPEGRYWKLDINKKSVEATVSEIDASRVDPEREALKVQAIRQAMNVIEDDIAAAGATLVKLQNYFKLLKRLR